ncbi:MAG: hypothetical protein M1832_000673 [Thelocarpon impressellum]|nr:MAG: hypothetical protein M1832_000673 [Thelocarpon impressellum]
MCRYALEAAGPRSAANAGACCAGFYETLIGHFLRVDPPKAYQWHRHLESSSFPPPDRSLARLAETVAFRSPASSAAFEQIYKGSTWRNLYGVIVPLLCSRGHSKAAEPLMYHLALYDDQTRLKALTRRLVDAGVSSAASTSKIFRDNTVISREMMNRILGETISIPPKPFNDAFCARLFATRALSILGVEAIGPLSMRELAVREGRPRALVATIQQMEAAGVSIGTSTFARLVKKFATENETDILEHLLASDQHPDALEDKRLQEALLASHMAAQDWGQMKRSLCRSEKRLGKPTPSLMLAIDSVAYAWERAGKRKPLFTAGDSGGGLQHCPRAELQVLNAGRILPPGGSTLFTGKITPGGEILPVNGTEPSGDGILLVNGVEPLEQEAQ